MQSGSAPQIKDYFENIDTPYINDMELQLQELVQQGVLTPEDAQAALAGESKMGGITLDPKLKQAQMQALSQLQDIGDSGGMNLTDQANLRKIQSEQDASARGSREAIIQGAQQRGLGGSGLDLMSQMQNQQDSATRASQRGTDVAAMAQQRALDAIIAGGAQAGNIGAQDFNQKAQVAGAQDAISKFNAQNQQATNIFNTQSRNDAQAMNLGAKQELSNANTGLKNQQQQYNKNLIQQDYENKLKKAGGQAGIAQSNAANQQSASQNQANANNQLIGGLIGAGSAYMGRKKEGGLVMGDPSDQDTMPHMLQPGEMVLKKDDVPEYMKKKHTMDDGDFDVAAFLDDVTGGKYGYSKKGKKNGK